MSEKINLNLDILNSLSEDEKQAAIAILRQVSETGTSDLLDELKYSDFEEIPVDIDTFLEL